MSVRGLPDLGRVKRVLIVRLSAIGDVVHALPVSAALVRAYPHLELSWVVEDMSAPMVVGNPYLKEVIILPRRRWKTGGIGAGAVWREYLAFRRELRGRRFDVCLDLQGYAKTALVALASGARWRLGWSRMRDGAGLVSRQVPRRPETRHRVDWFLDVVRALGVEASPVEFPLVIPAEARTRAAEELAGAGIAPGTPYAVLNPATGDQTRRWGSGRYGELAARLWRELALPTVLVGSSKDSGLNGQVMQRAGVGCRVIDLAGRTDLKQLAAVLDACAVHVCGDTGSAHIAAALRTPVVGIYGPTDPAHAGPWGQDANVIAHRRLCAPRCSERGCALVPDERDSTEPGARCLAAVTVDEVMDKIRAIARAVPRDDAEQATGTAAQGICS